MLFINFALVCARSVTIILAMPLLLLTFHIYCTKNLTKATGTFSVQKIL